MAKNFKNGAEMDAYMGTVNGWLTNKKRVLNALRCHVVYSTLQALRNTSDTTTEFRNHNNYL